MENIIKKIEALEPKHGLVESYEDEPTFIDGWNRAIGVVVDLLNSETEWKDAPDECNCFWWFRREFVLIIEKKSSLDCVFVTDVIDKDKRWVIFDLDIVGNYRSKYVDELEGKWQKAIMPIGTPK
jgi:hypothetical protein